ncbi:Na+/H+ antiporter [Actinobacillus equuli]|nr:Na+/H+ antiporter [Actinobacillus equuli]
MTTVSSMIYTGAQALETFSLLGAFENTNVNLSLVIGGFAGVLAVMLCTLGLINAADYPKRFGAVVSRCSVQLQF